MSFVEKLQRQRRELRFLRASIPPLCQVFVYTFITTSTIISDATSWLQRQGSVLISWRTQLTPITVPLHRGNPGGVILQESRENEMHSRCFQMVVIYGLGKQITKQKKKLNVIWALLNLTLNSVGFTCRWTILKIEQLQKKTNYQWLRKTYIVVQMPKQVLCLSRFIQAEHEILFFQGCFGRDRHLHLLCCGLCFIDVSIVQIISYLLSSEIRSIHECWMPVVRANPLIQASRAFGSHIRRSAGQMRRRIMF